MAALGAKILHPPGSARLPASRALTVGRRCCEMGSVPALPGWRTISCRLQEMHRFQQEAWRFFGIFTVVSGLARREARGAPALPEGSVARCLGHAVAFGFIARQLHARARVRAQSSFYTHMPGPSPSLGRRACKVAAPPSSLPRAPPLRPWCLAAPNEAPSVCCRRPLPCTVAEVRNGSLQQSTRTVRGRLGSDDIAGGEGPRHGMAWHARRVQALATGLYGPPPWRQQKPRSRPCLGSRYIRVHDLLAPQRRRNLLWDSAPRPCSSQAMGPGLARDGSPVSDSYRCATTQDGRQRLGSPEARAARGRDLRGGRIFSQAVLLFAIALRPRTFRQRARALAHCSAAMRPFTCAQMLQPCARSSVSELCFVRMFAFGRALWQSARTSSARNAQRSATSVGSQTSRRLWRRDLDPTRRRV